MPPSARPPPPGLVPSEPERNTRSPTRTALESTPPGRALGGLNTCLLPPCAPAVWFAAARASTVSDAIRKNRRTRMIEPRWMVEIVGGSNTEDRFRADTLDEHPQCAGDHAH